MLIAIFFVLIAAFVVFALWLRAKSRQAKADYEAYARAIGFRRRL